MNQHLLLAFDDIVTNDKWKCWCCLNVCCCRFETCPNENHIHCFTYRRTQRRHEMKAPKWTKPKRNIGDLFCHEFQPRNTGRVLEKVMLISSSETSAAKSSETSASFSFTSNDSTDTEESVDEGEKSVSRNSTNAKKRKFQDLESTACDNQARYSKRDLSLPMNLSSSVSDQGSPGSPILVDDDKNILHTYSLTESTIQIPRESNTDIVLNIHSQTITLSKTTTPSTPVIERPQRPPESPPKTPEKKSNLNQILNLGPSQKFIYKMAKFRALQNYEVKRNLVKPSAKTRLDFRDSTTLPNTSASYLPSYSSLPSSSLTSSLLTSKKLQKNTRMRVTVRSPGFLKCREKLSDFDATLPKEKDLPYKNNSETSSNKSTRINNNHLSWRKKSIMAITLPPLVDLYPETNKPLSLPISTSLPTSTSTSLSTSSTSLTTCESVMNQVPNLCACCMSQRSIPTVNLPPIKEWAGMGVGW
eukprot:TRINITY_DN11186_c0_g1_i1.p1 TRINITY_DN11186_c0_g1~~TRINITY_DN11186_c0_g1_i1.p1  ORF type:complete len:512 (+),score=77.77 TRINITY_DN11186_c0_g1_i1:118-1536(+)